MVLVTGGAGPARMSGDLVVRRAHVLDAAGRMDGPVDILVRDGVVRALGRTLLDRGEIEIDLHGSWLMPGMIDCHTHVSVTTRDELRQLRTPITTWGLEAADNLLRTLQGGVTTVRDAGGLEPGVPRGLSGLGALLPDVELSIVLLTHTGGQIDGYLPGPGHEIAASYLLPDYPHRPPFLVDGVDEVRGAVRKIVRAGATWLKLLVGGARTPHGVFGDDPIQFSPEEIRCAVVEARRCGRPTMVDAKTAASIRTAVEAGARSVEHGTGLDEQTVDLMARSGSWLVPTFSVYDDMLERATDRRARAGIERLRQDNRDGLRMAVDRGVRLAVGTDAVNRDMHGRNLRELALLGEAGLSSPEVLLAATAGGAELCGKPDRGRLEPGRLFDAVVLSADPSDLSVFHRPDIVAGVFRRGRVVPTDADRTDPLTRLRQRVGSPPPPTSRPSDRTESSL